MTFILSIFKLKKIFILLFFTLSLTSLSNSQYNYHQNINNKKCDYGQEYIKGQCVLPKISSNLNSFNTIPESLIDENGIYKYIQIKCEDKIFIRGRKDCKYHKNIYSKFIKELKEKNIDSKLCKVLGGGRINKNKKNKKIIIYGYSNRYGRAPNQHEITKDILSKFYSDYDITWTNDGY